VTPDDLEQMIFAEDAPRFAQKDFEQIELALRKLEDLFGPPGFARSGVDRDIVPA